MLTRGRQGGFSLLEMLVAMAILGLALGALYQAATGATRNVRTAERYAYGVELARSLVASYGMVPAGGVDQVGKTAGGYEWQVSSAARAMPRGVDSQVQLHDLVVVVSWFDGSKQRRVQLDTVVEAYRQ
jgi:general secretion pathway protein I